MVRSVHRDVIRGRGGLSVAASDSSSDAKKSADLVCDGTRDQAEINSLVAALPSSGGVIRFAAGTYEAEGINAAENVEFRGDGMHATRITLPASSSASMFLAPAQANVTGGGVFDMDIDGTTDSKQQHGIDLSAISTALNFYQIRRCYIHGFDHAYNGSGGTERFVPIEGCRIWNNNVGINATEHPIIIGCDIRTNTEAAVKGTLFDAIIVGTKFNDNQIGITDDAGSGVNSNQIIGCAFAGNVDFDIDLEADNTISGCKFLAATTAATGAGIIIKGSQNNISGCKWEPQGAFGWTDGCIQFARPDGSGGTQTSLNNIINGGCAFNNPTGVVIGLADSQKIVNSCAFRGNYARISARPVMLSTVGSLRNFSFCDNDIEVAGTIEDGASNAAPVFYYDSTSSNNSIKFDNNHIGKRTGSVDAIFRGDLTNASTFSLNRFFDFTETVIHASSTIDSDAIIRNNQGLVTENSGTGSIASGGTTSGNVAHGLDRTPSAVNFSISFTENPTNDPGNIWISGIDATNFVVNCRNDPGASNLDFSWQAIIL